MSGENQSNTLSIDMLSTLLSAMIPMRERPLSAVLPVIMAQPDAFARARELIGQRKSVCKKSGAIAPHATERLNTRLMLENRVALNNSRWIDPESGETYVPETLTEALALTVRVCPVSKETLDVMGDKLLGKNEVDWAPAFKNGWAAKIAAALHISDFRTAYGSDLIPSDVGRVRLATDVASAETPSYLNPLADAWERCKRDRTHLCTQAEGMLTKIIDAAPAKSDK